MAWGPKTREISTRAIGKLQIRIGDSASNLAVATPVLTSANSVGALASTKLTGVSEYHTFLSGFPEQVDGKVPLKEEFSLECAFQEIKPYTMALVRGISPLADISAAWAQLALLSSAGTKTGVITVTDAGGVVADTFIVIFTGATAGKIVGMATGEVATFAAIDAEIAPDNTGNPYFSIPANFFSGTWADGESYVFRTSPFVTGSAAFGDAHNGSISLGNLKAPAFIRVEGVLTFPNETDQMIVILPKATSAGAVDMDAGNADIAMPVKFEANTADADSGGNAAWNDAPTGIIIFDQLG